MTTYVRFVDEGEVEANEEIAAMLLQGLIAPCDIFGHYELLDKAALDGDYIRLMTDVLQSETIHSQPSGAWQNTEAGALKSLPFTSSARSA